MKNISASLKTHIGEDLLTMATCWRVTRRDGLRLGFTTHDQPLEIGTTVYKPVTGFQPSNISSSSGFNVDNLEVTAVLSDASIGEEDILAGHFDHAGVEIFQVNWADLSQGILSLRAGWLGEIILKDDHFTAEIRGVAQKLQQEIGAVYSPECRVDLGSDRCHANLSAVTVVSKVTSSAALDGFTDSLRLEAAGWYDYALLRWVTGQNAGRAAEVKNFSNGEFRFVEFMPYVIEVGDIYKTHAGCDKRSSTCRTKFSNFANFRGEPAVPGQDALFDYPGLK